MSDERDDVNDDAWDAFPSPAAGLPRRTLLGTAVGGLALAASGLLLPGWLVEEAEADKHPVRGVQHRKDRQRDKHRHKKHDKRRHRRTKDHKRGSGPGMHNVAIFVHNYRAVPVWVRGWEVVQRFDDFRGTYKIPSGWDWAEIPAKAADGSHSVKEFIGSRSDVAVVIAGGDLIVQCRDFNFIPPAARIVEGAFSDKGLCSRCQPPPKQLALNPAMFINQSMTVDDGKLKMTRVDNTPNHVRFSVDLT